MVGSPWPEEHFSVRKCMMSKELTETKNVYPFRVVCFDISHIYCLKGVCGHFEA